MSIQHFVQNCEMKFWNAVTPVMGKNHSFHKFGVIKAQLVQNKRKYLTVLVIIWGTAGFVAGLLIGRIIDLLSVV